ncbi:3-methyl-2-oxobutanoate hydroxymethyltransferase [Commensalibacter oyaizuii]|uniref:3-methyl-2-oxobutanoate hydroxymethyltransferase n=1 Tax=Commensalibacter oyaizuii TaxID=3043873 RepID=A0ABT6Q076_9PROT|nr:3-methyl-2-oxobutanoate hydroxymethyltransferase [Commensalibacter sp. TBRC 16381]MDI2090363.1 3-methyl-2-oxobutanoate hydroxymethyltransferase [Commensalibacter sp. TBRC 16381]
MDNNDTVKRLTVPDIMAKKGKDPVVSLTAYTTPVAQLMDSYVDLVLVGDSLGMVIYGLPTTLSVTTEMMIAHGQAVMRGTKRACVMVDLPFASYHESPQQAFRTAARILQETGAAAVKLEGGEEMAETVEFLTKRGIPVCGHVGLMPQAVQMMGGFKVAGKNDIQIQKVIQDSHAIANAGAFAIVLEGIIEPVAQTITQQLSIPTIGIGASPTCDGQVLVCDDIFGVFQGFKPKFVKRYAQVGQIMEEAVKQYASEVRSRSFPSMEYCFQPKKS